MQIAGWEMNSPAKKEGETTMWPFPRFRISERIYHPNKVIPAAN